VTGDAGGFVNAYTAEGIYYAMVSGELAGRAILAADDPGDPRPGSGVAGTYIDAWRREIGSELRDARLIQRYLFRDAARIDGVVLGATRHREVADMIVGYAMGSLPYATARRRLLARFPRVLFRLARIGLSGIGGQA
jgi:flavin-dependent dehydrogenase